MNRLQRARWVGCLSVLAVAAAAKSQDPSPGRQAAPIQVPTDALLPVSLPMNNWHGLPTIDVGVNTSLSQRFAVDTGLDANTIRPDAVANLQLATLPTKVRVQAL